MSDPAENHGEPSAPPRITRRKLLSMVALAIGASAFAAAVAQNDAELTEATEIP